MSSFAPALMLAGGLTDVDSVLFYTTLILFALFALLLSKFAWGPLLKAIEEREKSIKDTITASEKANSEAQALLAQHKELVRQIGAEREAIVKKATKEAEEFKADLLARTRSEAEELTRRAKEQIEREKTIAITKLREEVADLAVLGASKIVTSSMSPEAQKKLVADFVQTLPSSKN